MKRVLDVGQCGADHGAIRHLLARNFQADVAQAHDLDDALLQLRAGSFDLVLVNRVLDADGGDGLDVIRRIKAEPSLSAIPVMLVSNYPEYQERAIAAGAEPGFGKAQLNSPATGERFKKFLA